MNRYSCLSVCSTKSHKAPVFRCGSIRLKIALSILGTMHCILFKYCIWNSFVKWPFNLHVSVLHSTLITVSAPCEIGIPNMRTKTCFVQAIFLNNIVYELLDYSPHCCYTQFRSRRAIYKPISIEMSIWLIGVLWFYTYSNVVIVCILASNIFQIITLKGNCGDCLSFPWSS